MVYYIYVVRSVIFSKLVEKQLRKMPIHVVDKLMAWTRSVNSQGLDEVRKVPGFHDEPLHGDRKGQRSIRLSRGYRAIYRITEDMDIECVKVEEVSKHDY